MTIRIKAQRRAIPSLLIVIAAFLVGTLFSHSLLIAIAFALFIALFIFIAQQKSESKRHSAIHGACPEMIDILISGVQSG
jgi:tight adherence protein B